MVVQQGSRQAYETTLLELSLRDEPFGTDAFLTTSGRDDLILLERSGPFLSALLFFNPPNVIAH